MTFLKEKWKCFEKEVNDVGSVTVNFIGGCMVAIIELLVSSAKFLMMFISICCNLHEVICT